MPYDVVAAEARPGFRVWVKFQNGVEGEADLSELVGKGVFGRWLDTPGEFAQVRVDPESGTLSWPGGLDLAPDRLYSEVLRSQNGVEASTRL